MTTAASGGRPVQATAPRPVNARDETAQLLRAAAAGDQRAWDLLVDRFARLLWSVTSTFGLSEADAADVCQTTWLHLVEHLSAITDPDRLAGWLATTARREASRVLRANNRVLLFERPETSLFAVDDSPDPMAAALEQEERQAIQARLRALPPRSREVVSSTLEGNPVDQIARALGIAPSTVRGHLLHARRVLANTAVRPAYDGATDTEGNPLIQRASIGSLRSGHGGEDDERGERPLAYLKEDPEWWQSERSTAART